MGTPHHANDIVRSALDWLAAEPGDDPVEDLSVLRGHLARLGDGGVSAAQLRQCMDALEARALDICGRVRAKLLHAALPLPRGLHQAAGDLVDALLAVAAAVQRLAEAGQGRWRRRPRVDSAALAARSLGLLGEAYLVACMAGASAPAGLWRHAHALFGALGAADDGQALADPAARATRSYKRLLAMAVSEPEALTARELAWLFDYLEGAVGPARLGEWAKSPEPAACWIDPSRDAGPVAAARRAAPVADGLVHLSLAPLARRIGEQIAWLELRLTDAALAGVARKGDLGDADGMELPEGLAPSEVLSLARRLQARWAAPPRRTQPRRPQQYTVRVCIGLKAIWDAHRDGEAGGRGDEWMVCNESPGGYAIMSVAGIEGALVAGTVLALRRDLAESWTLCLVRWVRNDDPDRVELGLQVISQACTPVTVAFRQGAESAPVPALILPPMGAVRRADAILAPAGTSVARRFVVVRDDERVYVAQARVVSLDLQTASVELFQYEIDSYPG